MYLPYVTLFESVLSAIVPPGSRYRFVKIRIASWEGTNIEEDTTDEDEERCSGFAVGCLGDIHGSGSKPAAGNHALCRHGALQWQNSHRGQGFHDRSSHCGS